MTSPLTLLLTLPAGCGRAADAGAVGDIAPLTPEQLVTSPLTLLLTLPVGSGRAADAGAAGDISADSVTDAVGRIWTRR